MGEVRSTVTLFNNMTPALQSITNALNMTISHFEQMQRVSENSIDVTGFEAARAEIRNAEATVAEMQEALTSVARNGMAVTRGFDEIGIAASSAGQTVSQAFQTVQQQQSTVMGFAGAFENTMQQVTQAIQEQTNEIMIMSDAIYQVTNKIARSRRRQTEQVQQQTEQVQQQTEQVQQQIEQIGLLQRVHERINSIFQRRTEQVQQQTEQVQQQTEQVERQTQQVGLLQRVHERINNIFQRRTEQTRRQTEQTQRQTQQIGLLQRAYERIRNILQRQTEQTRQQTEQTRRQTEQIQKQTQQLGLLQRGYQQVNNSANGLLGTLKGIAGVYLSFQGMSAVGNLSDNITSVTSRLSMMNDGMRTTQELSDVIMKSAFDSGAGYLDTAEAIAKMGLNAGSAFESNSELITFMEQINKMFAIGGASASEQSNAMVQLSQAMAAGALRGEELNSILDAAPGIARNIEKYMGYAEGSIKEYAEDGKITAQVVKNAMIALAEETNEKFNSMPTTISRTFEKIRTLAVRSFAPVLQGLNGLFNNQNAEKILYYWGAVFQYIADRANVTIEKLKNILNSEQFDAFSQDIMTIFAAAGAVVTWLFDTVVNGFNYVVDHWEQLKPLFEGAAVAIGLVTAAQWALNIAMAANPVTLIIAGVVVLIALLYKVVDHINKVKNTSISVTGILAGVFAGLYAIIKNVVVGVWNKVAEVVNFVHNLSKDVVAAIKVLFYDLVDDALASIQTIVQGIRSLTEHIPSISIVTEGLEKADDWLTQHRNNVKDLSQKIKNESGWEEFLPRLEYTNVYEAVENAYNKVAGFGDGFKDFMKDFDPFKGVESTNDLLAGILKNTQNMAKNTDDISKELQMDKEDLEFLKTAANIKYGDKYVMPQVKIEMVNHNNIQSEMDLDGFFDRKIDEMADILNQSAEGVHI